MRTEAQARANAIRLAPCAILTGALAALLFMGVAANRSHADEPEHADWLKCNENGEPYEATLADGTVLKLGTYGDEYDAYEYRPPLTGDKAEFVFGADRGPNVGWGDLAIDPKRQTIYWREGSSKVTRIMRAGLNGAGAGSLMDFNELSPTHITPDPAHGKLYWYAQGLPNGSGRAIYRADLNGKNARPIIQDISASSAESVGEVWLGKCAKGVI